MVSSQLTTVYTKPSKFVKVFLADCRYTKHTVSNLLNANVAWYYTWKLTPKESYFMAPACIEFVPMVYSHRQANPKKLARAPGDVLLGFNEPDSKNHANMKVTDGIRVWPRLMATGKRLGSPAGANNIVEQGSWMDLFMKEATARNYRVDFMTVHYYGMSSKTWSNITRAVEDMRVYLEGVHAKYKRPIWVTEWSLVKWGPNQINNKYASSEAQAKFAKYAAQMMDKLPFVERYAYFSLIKYEPPATSYLYDSHGAITPVGQAYRSVEAK